MHTAYLAFGANLGDCFATFRAARACLAKAEGVRVDGASSLYRTEAVGGPPGQPPYLNAVLRVATELSPEKLLALGLDLEARFGRRRLEPWGPRTLDIDLLLYDDLLRAGPELTLPHPRLYQRRFVLAPLAELAADLRHPLLDRTIGELLAELDDPAGVQPLPDPW
ncbi:2-amino-4-hydroxy-6-hydroxymethyldihydropteridine diphosphokinase [Trichloromonas sp.]|uniref:2-amino-4-hydroxy-6- hydroxymethyldihydropteridine diphosphokinase n=1 Tax=Trichloromonas sp. TaxID=3069249 RepID=UPI002A3C0750|nr:2-amino-4-hydroxy-6-hydroxymethyldihydropteridine diphosphokinase [Trichloromonas sp.]